MRVLGLVATAGLLALASCTTVTDRAGEATERATSSALGWSPANAPIHIRTFHTATLLGTNQLLVAGGAASPTTTELVDLAGKPTVAGPTLLAPRANHTATLLLSGKVLLAGGTGQSSAELYDPLSGTVTATSPMSRVRAGHLAVRLGSGKVLVLGGSGDATAELFDPATGTFALTASHTTTDPAAATTLADGRVLVVSAAPSGGVELFDPATETFTSQLSVLGTYEADVRTLTRRADGKVTVGETVYCAATSGGSFCSSQARVFDPGTGVAGTPMSFPNGRITFGAARLVDESVVFLGGVLPVDRLAAGATALASDGNLAMAYGTATASVVPGGDTLVLGGTQAAIDRRTATGVRENRAGVALATGRQRHAAVRLHDGRVLVTGGVDDGLAPNDLIASAEILDLVTGQVTAVPNMNFGRQGHALTTLRDGTVLVTGGGTASAELYTPGGAFSTLPAMNASRGNHAATLLPSGEVLLVGGDAAGTAELYDPAARVFRALPTPTTGKDGTKGLVLLPTGSVLVVGGSGAEIFDPSTRTFRVVTPPGAARDGSTARLLANGRVFVAGGDTLAADLFDPVTETWSFSAPQSSQVVGARWTPFPDGRLVGAGGRGVLRGTIAATAVFDSLAATSGALAVGPALSRGAYEATVTLAGTGELAVIGGTVCYGDCHATAETHIDVLTDGAPTFRPTITAAPAEVVAGARVTISGTGFTGVGEGSSGRTASSASNAPLAYWVSDANDAVVPGTIADFTATSATWIVPPTALHGHGQLFVAVGGVLSRGQGVTITPALAATGCAYDAECATGFCVDGVCCDRRCDGACEGCSAKHKLSGDDGVCGAVPPGQDIYGRCVLKLGDACTAKEQCGPNFCAPQGVCCDSACEGQCLSCALPGKVGTCSAINEGACGAACDGAHTLKQVGVPDHDCAPFTCEGAQCKSSCASVKDCVAPAVCSVDGLCVPAPAAAPADVSVFGCASSPRRAGGASMLLVLASLGAALGRRRR